MCMYTCLLRLQLTRASIYLLLTASSEQLSAWFALAQTNGNACSGEKKLRRMSEDEGADMVIHTIAICVPATSRSC
jgi:hypothetical protein